MNRDTNRQGGKIGEEALTRSLRSLPRRSPSPELRSALRVMASHERQRAVQGPTSSVWLDRFQLFAQNLMRPLALPFAGGIFSTVVAFSMWLSTGYPVHASNGFDIPIPLTSKRAEITTLVTKDPSVLQTAPIQASGLDDVVVDVTIDGQGTMTGYTIVSGNADDLLKRQIDSVLLLTKFNPAKTLGAPVEGKIRLSLSALHSHIDVKG